MLKYVRRGQKYVDTTGASIFVFVKWIRSRDERFNGRYTDANSHA